MWTSLLVSIFFGLFTSVASASTCEEGTFFYESERQGWYWRRLCGTDEENHEEDAVVSQSEKQHQLLKQEKVEIPWETLERLDPEEINRMERESRKIAVMRPSEENVREYMRFKNWLVDKAQAFTKTTEKLAKTDPELASRIARTPISSYAKETQTRFKVEAAEEILRSANQKTGLVLMGQKSCIYCREQAPIVDLFARTYGWHVEYIDIQEKPVLAQTLDVRPVPDLFIILNRNEQPIWQRIGIGLHTLDELKKSILFGLFLLGEIQDESLIH